MAAPEFRRARDTVIQGRGVVAVNHVCGILAGLLYVGWMILLIFCMDLLVHRGDLEFDSEQSHYVRELFAEAGLEFPLTADPSLVEEVGCREAGLLPTLIRVRNQWYAPALERAYGSIPGLRNNIGLLITIFVLAIGIGLVRLILLGIQGRLLVDRSSDAQARLQLDIFRKQFELGPAAVDSATRERLEPLLKREIPQIVAGVQTYMDRIPREPAKIVALLVLALVINPALALTFVILAALAWVVGARFVRGYVERGRRLVATADGAMNRLLGLAGKHRLIGGYNAEEYYNGRFLSYVEQARRSTRERLTYEGRLVPLWQFAGLVIFIVILLLAAQNVLTGVFELSAAAGFFASLLSLSLPIYNLVGMRSSVRDATRAARQLFAFLDLPVPVRQKQGTSFLAPLKESIDYEKVEYTDMDGTTILSDVSIRVHRGQRIAIVGKNEAERRAFIYLLARFIDPSSGRVKIDGKDIRRGTLESLRAQVAVVLQDELLFPDTIAGNIGCGDTAYQLTQITEAAKVAHAHNFIQKLPYGYECVVGDEGFPLKPGEAYRIALARAILRDPPILCIEEPREPLDPDSNALLDDTIERLFANRTVIVVPSRLSTIRSCDQVFLFAEGKLASVGSHRELLETSELYRHLQYVEFTTPQFAS